MSENGTRTEIADEKVSILIVDDRPDKLLTYEVMLAELDQTLVRATSGKEALRCLLQQDFAVILLDVNMPGMDGFETAAMIRQRGRSETTPIIFISAVNDTVNHVARGYSLGAVDYILTPVVPEILRAKIGVFVDLFKKTEQVKRQVDERAHLISEQAARAEAEVQQQRLAFLADASNALAASLDYQQTFRNLVHVIVPRLADFCIIDVAEEKRLRRVAVAHRDPAQTPRLQDDVDAPMPGMHKAHATTRIFESGQPQLRCEVDEAGLHELFDTEHDREFIRSLKPSSFLAVPLRIGERVLGLITMVNASPDRPCGPRELSLGVQLAERAALAVENAALYQAAQQARTEAERASNAKDRFLAMLSHELRTPLTPVLASVCVLEDENNISEETRAALQVIRRNVELEARLIDDLLDLTRISKGKVQLSFEIADAHTLLCNALEICYSEIDSKNLVLETRFAATNARLRADPARLQQIFWNLIKNAVKFTRSGGKLSVRTNNDPEGRLCVEITDSGQGIAPELLPKIFNAFEQGERAQLGGLGLGLAISKALVESHAGQIFAESEGPERGAKFTTVFPTSQELIATRETTSPAPASDRRSMRILLVEDHHDTNRSLTQLLERRGYDVKSASNVASALKLAAGRKFDVLISDIGLPDGTGTELMEKLRNGHSMFAIALTGFGMEEDIQRSHAVGFNHHLIKPVDLNKLDALLQTAPVAAK